MKRILSLLLAMVLLLGILPVTTLAAEPVMSDGIYQIGTAEDLLWFAETVNGGETGLKAVLTADIDLSSTANWPGIGTDTNKFAGSFDGQCHTVTFKDSKWGLFGYVLGTSNALVTIKNVKTVGTIQKSGIVHNAGYVHFTNCINGATIDSNGSYVAGIVGTIIGITEAGVLKSDVRLTNCGNEASVAGYQNIAGLVGYTKTSTSLSGCYNTGNIHGDGSVGGLVGYMQGSYGSCKVENSYNTGRVTGEEKVGGIVGCMMNDTSVTNCYNTGSTVYAIVGHRFNNTATVKNSYYLGTASSKCSPDYNETKRFDDTTYEIKTRATAKSAAEMATAAFASLLGSSFKQSCPTPVLSWQTAVEHTGSVCANCKLGSTEMEIYEVSFQQHDGYTFDGESRVTQGDSYSFTMTISAGYEKAADFAVKVNGVQVEPDANGKYTAANVSGPLSVTVIGVNVVPGSRVINLPGSGNGYTVSGAKTVLNDKDYEMTVTFKDGFKAGKNFTITAEEILTQEQIDNGAKPSYAEVHQKGSTNTYVLYNVKKNYRILISGVEAVSQIAPVTVTFTVTEGKEAFHVPNDSDEVMMDVELTVPYFDLSLYGLEKYYYNPYCYIDENGTIRSQQKKGTPESAYDHITVMHAYIVATELYYLGYSQKEAGTGLSYQEDPTAFRKAISWSQDAGSSFMDFWDHGTNMNYYVNYKYPLAYAGWGSTSDQIEIKNGDVISVHLITGQGSGSNFGFFTVNDTNSKYNPGKDVVDSYTVDQGEKIKLTHYWTVTSGNYDTSYALQANKQLYWIKADDLTQNEANMKTWGGWNAEDEVYEPLPFGKNGILNTDANGTVTINTAGIEPGTYYIGALGGFTEGGGADNAGFVSAGAESGAAYFRLTINEYDAKLGDVNQDTKITADDAALILRHVAKLATVNEGVADVSGDGKVTADDAALVLRYVAKLISSFPADETNE